jgi:hypothetical protein
VVAAGGSSPVHSSSATCSNDALRASEIASCPRKRIVWPAISVMRVSIAMSNERWRLASRGRPFSASRSISSAGKRLVRWSASRWLVSTPRLTYA